MVPLTFPFVFKIGSYTDPDDNSTHDGLGVAGAWIACVIGLMYQLTIQLYINHRYADWDKISKEVSERMQYDN